MTAARPDHSTIPMRDGQFLDVVRNASTGNIGLFFDDDVAYVSPAMARLLADTLIEYAGDAAGPVCRRCGSEHPCTTTRKAI